MWAFSFCFCGGKGARSVSAKEGRKEGPEEGRKPTVSQSISQSVSLRVIATEGNRRRIEDFDHRVGSWVIAAEHSPLIIDRSIVFSEEPAEQAS